VKVEELMAELSDANGLRTFVYETLCHHERLEMGHFRMTERLLRTGTESWGVLFRLVGPRQVQASAVWAWKQGKLMFYSSSGRKFQQSDVAIGLELTWQGVVEDPNPT
jgi:hypothetical protein